MILTKKDALIFTGLDKKTFDNYLVGGEFACQERNNGRGRFYFDQDALKEWMVDRKWRTVELTREDYALCLDFALAQHFKKYVMSDFGTGRQREFGQKITNWVKGQLGEIGVQKFFKDKFNKIIRLDFDLHDEIVPQDIISVIENNKERQPKIGIGIKSSKPKNVFLVLGENEIDRPERRSDVYIYCRPDIPDDHLLRITKEAIQEIVKGMPHYEKYKAQMPEFANIPCEIVGWCRYDEFEKTNEIPGQEFDGMRFVKASGSLKHSKSDWEELIKQI
jgi:hypothetical protein